MEKENGRPGGLSSNDGTASVSTLRASIPDAVFVVVRSVGEYSDRIETPIRFCLTEKDAQDCIATISIEAQRDACPDHKHNAIYGHQMPDGTWLPDDEAFLSPRKRVALWRLKPEADKLREQNDQWDKEYDEAVKRLNHADPEGSWCGEEYYYAEVTFWTAKATKAGTGSVHAGAVGETDLPNPTPKEPTP